MKTRTLAVLTVALLWAAVPAYAQSPLKDTYGGPGQVASNVGAVGGSQKPAAPPLGSAGSSPSAGAVKTATAAGSRSAVAAQRASTAPSGARAIRKASASLPFTGFDVLLMLAAGAALLGAGIVMQRLARPRA